ELYLRTGLIDNRPEASKIGMEILESEIDRYARNIVYYQSLNPVQYSTLQNTDKYIDRYFFWDLLQTYVDFGGDTDKLEKSLAALGVNLNRLAAMQDQNSQAAKLQAAEPADAAPAPFPADAD
ncbi:MAG: hypothetical protein K2I58_00310, partial [Candidatus Amulumruptor sp.]|nr:hypothetical protein [Candidatus Amulumruptor sp.]